MVLRSLRVESRSEAPPCFHLHVECSTPGQGCASTDLHDTCLMTRPLSVLSDLPLKSSGAEPQRLSLFEAPLGENVLREGVPGSSCMLQPSALQLQYASARNTQCLGAIVMQCTNPFLYLARDAFTECVPALYVAVCVATSQSLRLAAMLRGLLSKCISCKRIQCPRSSAWACSKMLSARAL